MLPSSIFQPHKHCCKVYHFFEILSSVLDISLDKRIFIHYNIFIFLRTCHDRGKISRSLSMDLPTMACAKTIHGAASSSRCRIRTATLTPNLETAIPLYCTTFGIASNARQDAATKAILIWSISPRVPRWECNDSPPMVDF